MHLWGCYHAFIGFDFSKGSSCSPIRQHITERKNGNYILKIEKFQKFRSCIRRRSPASTVIIAGVVRRAMSYLPTASDRWSPPRPTLLTALSTPPISGPQSSLDVAGDTCAQVFVLSRSSVSHSGQRNAKLHLFLIDKIVHVNGLPASPIPSIVVHATVDEIGDFTVLLLLSADGSQLDEGCVNHRTQIMFAYDKYNVVIALDMYSTVSSTCS